MIKLIIGNKGSGKTKILIDIINQSLNTSEGNVVVLDKTTKLRYDVKPSARLVDVDAYKIEGHDAFYGMVCGILAGNYDITDICVDSILKIVGRDYDKLGEMFDKIEAVANENKVNVTFTVSADISELPESVKKYA